MEGLLNNHMEQRKANIMKGFTNADELLEKSEGSRGGTIIGHTVTGKPIYAGSKIHYDTTEQMENHKRHLNSQSIKYEVKDDEDHILVHGKTKKWENPDATKYKSVDGDIEKAEGSRGGEVIGHTASGKPIYSHKGVSDYNNFTPKDHADAAKAHRKIKDDKRTGANLGINASSKEHLIEQAKHHATMASQHAAHSTDFD
jgi:hypothetical protein